MKLVESNNDKATLYHRYIKIIRHPKPYDKITIDQIYQEIIDYYNYDYHRVLDMLTVKEQEFIFMFEFFDDYYFYYLTRDSLIEKCLLVKDDERCYLPEELSNTITRAAYSLDCKKQRIIDKRNELLTGILAIKGLISIDELINIYHRFDQSLTTIELSDHILNNRQLSWHYYIYQDDTNLILAYEKYRSYIDDIATYQKYYQRFELPYNQKQLQAIGTYSLDTTDQTIEKLVLDIEFIEDDKLRYFIFNNIIKAAATRQDHCLEIELIDESAINRYDLPQVKKIKETYQAALIKIHSASLHGLSLDKYLTSLFNTNPFKQADCNIFINTYFNILDYVNQKYHISSTSVYQAINIDEAIVDKIRIQTFNERLLDQYIDDHPKLLAKQISIIDNLKNALIDDFLILENRGCYSIVANQNHVFAVYSVSYPLSSRINTKQLPQMVQLILIPYQDKIIYDGYCRFMPAIYRTNQITKYQESDIIYTLTKTNKLKA